MRGWKKTTVVTPANPVEGDLYLEGGTSVVLEGDAAVYQEIRSRLLLIRGTGFTDLREGVPLFEEVLRKGTSTARVRAIYRQAILAHPQIIDVPRLDVSVDRQTRTATIAFEARAATGRKISSADFGPVLITDPKNYGD